MHLCYTLCHKNWTTVHQLMAIPLSKPNRFSKFLTVGKTSIVNKTHILNADNIYHHTQSVQPHCPWKIKVQICNRLETFDEIKHILSDGSADTATVKLKRLLEMFAFCLHTCTLEDGYASRQLQRQ